MSQTTHTEPPTAEESRAAGDALLPRPGSLAVPAGLLALVLAAASVWRYVTWHASVYDFGIYLQALWLIAHGHLLARDSLLPGNMPILGDTFSVVWYALAPVAGWGPGGAYVLLVLQAACLAAYAGLMGAYAGRVTGSPGWASWGLCPRRLLRHSVGSGAV